MDFFNTFLQGEKKVLLIFMCLWVTFATVGQSPTVKIDFDMAGRQAAEVNESGYESWNTYGTDAISNTYQGITFTLEKSGVNGDGLRSNWYKAGIGAARLVSDGVTVDNGIDGGEILLTISGLSSGDHTLLIFYNNVDSPDAITFSPIDVYVNDILVEDNVIPSERAASNYDAMVSYLTLNATEGVDMSILFKADLQGNTAIDKNVMINGIELNTPNVIKQASFPLPDDADEHVDVSTGDVILSWTGARTAVSHNVYFSEDASEIMVANTGSPAFIGNQVATTYAVSGLNRMSTYYWRIDEVDAEDHITKGEVWYFRPRQVAFPGAEGHGRYARGGRNGKVVHVTNLNDSGVGSFIEAIENETGPRTIVFDVSGIIALESRLTLSDGYVTVAGQTAPGKGICIRSAPFGLSGANDVIIQNIRVRLGSGTTYDGIGMQGSNHCIIDHCSISWTIDEAFSSRSAKNITLQRTLISEALNIAGHANYPEGAKHGYAASISGDIGSFHHNLLAHCYGRN